MPQGEKIGRIDVHCHLLPGVDDGCQTIEQSLQCARMFVEEGYTHVFCTPHIWPNLKDNQAPNILDWTASLQKQLGAASIPLKVLPGGEISLRPDYAQTPPEQIPSYSGAGRFVLFDFWADRLPPHFEPTVRWFRSLGLQPIMAHPERVRAVQDDPGLADYFQEIGLLLQGNLYCLVESSLAPPIATQTALRFLVEKRYFMLGSDCHGPDTLPIRFAGLQRAVELVGRKAVDRLTIDTPRQLLP